MKFNFRDNAALKVAADVEVAGAAALGVPVPLPAGVIETEVEVDGAVAVTPKPLVLAGIVVGISDGDEELVDLAEDLATDTLVLPVVLGEEIVKGLVAE